MTTIAQTFYKLTEAQHHYHDNVLATHVHLDEKIASEVVIMK